MCSGAQCVPSALTIDCCVEHNDNNDFRSQMHNAGRIAFFLFDTDIYYMPFTVWTWVKCGKFVIFLMDAKKGQIYCQMHFLSMSHNTCRFTLALNSFRFCQDFFFLLSFSFDTKNCRRKSSYNKKVYRTKSTHCKYLFMCDANKSRLNFCIHFQWHGILALLPSAFCDAIESDKKHVRLS